MLKIGILSDRPRSFRKDLSRGRVLYHFSFASEQPSFSRIFDSGLSTPSRYVEELFFRLSHVDVSEGHQGTFIFNPYAEFSKPDIAFAIESVSASDTSQIVVFVDPKRRPIGYFFPRDIPESEQYRLRLLSTADGDLDAKLLSALFRQSATCRVLSAITINPYRSNGFLAKNGAIFEGIARRTLAQLESGQACELKSLIALMPYHAGDVALVSLAMRHTRSAVTRLAVNNAYVQIVATVAPSVSTHSLPGSLYARGPAASSEPATEGEYFEQIKNTLPADGFLIYLRPSRGITTTRFHLIDQFAFALGRRFFRKEDLLFHNLPAVSAKPRPLAAKPSVLVHFDAGWPLKIYPEKQQQELIDRLNERGFSVSVLLRERRELRGCAVHIFETLDQLTALMVKQNLVIGMDSFPAHWSTFILGIPTIGLFGHTNPDTARGPVSPNYILLENGMACRPCFSLDTCPIYRTDYCRNFVSPSVVVEAADRILSRPLEVQNEASEIDRPSVPSDRVSLPDFANGDFYHLPSRLIRTRLFLFQRPIFYRLCYAEFLVRGFFAEMKSRGRAAATYRARRFMRMQIHRVTAKRKGNG